MRAFVDSNILVYGHDSGAGRRFEIASDLLRGLWLNRAGVLSTQVIQEFYVNVRRKARLPISAEEAVRLVEDYICWDVVVNDESSIRGALGIEQRYQISFWDALIIQAAQVADVEIVYSEDLNHGQSYGPVQVVNPFVGSDAS